MSNKAKKQAESAVVKMAHQLLERIGFRMYRNNIGQVRYPSGAWVRYGLCNPGGSDLIGWLSVVVTPEMVGQRVAVFTACENKTNIGELSVEQAAFLDSVRAAGGIAGVVRDANDAIAMHPTMANKARVTA